MKGPELEKPISANIPLREQFLNQNDNFKVSHRVKHRMSIKYNIAFCLKAQQCKEHLDIKAEVTGEM